MRKKYKRGTKVNKTSKAVKKKKIDSHTDSFGFLYSNEEFLKLFSEQSQKGLTFTLDFHAILFFPPNGLQNKKNRGMTSLSQLKGQSPVRRHIKFEFIII